MRHCDIPYLGCILTRVSHDRQKIKYNNEFSYLPEVIFSFICNVLANHSYSPLIFSEFKSFVCIDINVTASRERFHTSIMISLVIILVHYLNDSVSTNADDTYECEPE